MHCDFFDNIRNRSITSVRITFHLLDVRATTPTKKKTRISCHVDVIILLCYICAWGMGYNFSRHSVINIWNFLYFRTKIYVFYHQENSHERLIHHRMLKLFTQSNEQIAHSLTHICTFVLVGNCVLEW